MSHVVEALHAAGRERTNRWHQHGAARRASSCTEWMDA